MSTMAEPGEILPERNVDMASLYEMLRQSKSSVEQIVAKMLSLKSTHSFPDSPHVLPQLVTQILLNFVTLRQANRSILLEEDRVKAETERAKAPVDLTTLQLHNLMYEKNHYVKAIKACKDFKTKYPDIELVPEEDFFRDAPEDIKNTVVSNDSAHNLMLQRLDYELFQRKELFKLCDKLEQQKKALQETIGNRKKFLSSLPSHLKALKKASIPVQHQLGILHSKKMKQQQLAELLPPPLYVIYSQLLAQKEAFGEHIDLEIIGSVKDAQAFARQLANKETVLGENIKVEGSRIEDDIPDEEDDGQRRRKRPKKVPSKENLDQSGIYQTHPLKLTLHINDDEEPDRKLITLKLEYLVKLNVVCVAVDGPEEDPEDSTLLCNLFPDDTGLELPLQSAKLLSGGDSVSFHEKRSSRPYKWAQHLAGIDFLPELPPLLTAPEISNNETKQAAVISGLSLYRQQRRVYTVLQRVRARVKAQLALKEQFDSLMKLKWPTLTCGSVPWASHTPRCNLHCWTLVTCGSKKTSSLPDVEQIQGPLSAGADAHEKSAMQKEEVEVGTEDGELPSLTAASVSKGSEFERSRRLSLISKSIISPISQGSFKKKPEEEDNDLIVESENELNDPLKVEEESDDAFKMVGPGTADNIWADCGVLEYNLLITRKFDNGKRSMNLDAKVKISMEYPLRPPYFELSLCTSLHGSNYYEAGDDSEWYNELRAMEAEVNVHMLKMIPSDEENLVLAHQVRFLSMLFDFYVEDGDASLEKRESTSLIDVGLCKPITGRILTRSFRGRDRRKMISWKDNICAAGYP